MGLLEQSHLDPGGTLKDSHEQSEKALRTLDVGTLVPKSHTRIVLTYNATDCLTQVKYYNDATAEVNEIVFIPDVAGSLNSTYFLINSARDERNYYVWYDVSSGGTDPTPGGIGIEVDIVTGDAAAVIALATKVAIETLTSSNDDFTVVRDNITLTITNKNVGPTTNISDAGSTGFGFTVLTDATEDLVATLDLIYDTNNNLIDVRKT